MKIIATIAVTFFLLVPALAWSQTKTIKILTIPTKSRLCPGDTHKGDREFAGHGPRVLATARLQIVAKTRVTLTLTLYAVETVSDFTEASGRWTYTVYQVPSGYKVNRILTDTYSQASYVDSNHSLDTPSVTNGRLVRRFEINGDTGGNDIGNCTLDDVYMNVQFNEVRIEIQQLEKIISGFTALSDYPRQATNKLSRDIRAVAGDGARWYFTQTESLWKIPVTFDLNAMGTLQPESTEMVDIPPLLERKGYRRFGDLDYYRGYLFVALEGDGQVNGRPLIAIYNVADMTLAETVNLGQWQNSIGWIAINPVTGILYTSHAGLTAAAKRFKIAIASGKVTLAPSSDYPLRLKTGISLSLLNPQSGSFSADGRYLFVVDRQGTGSRLLSFNHRTGREMVSSSFIGSGSELRAISCVNTGTRAPGIRGVLHLVESHPDPQARDAFSLKHYSVLEGFDWNN